MTITSGKDVAGALPLQRRRPKAGERTRGTVDALQTKIAVNLQKLSADDHLEQLRANVAELPDASGCDAAFLVLIEADSGNFEHALSSSTVFCGCNPNALQGESLEDWPWLARRLGHLRLVDITDTEDAPQGAAPEFSRLAELNIASCLVIGFDVCGELAGFLAIANQRPVDVWDAGLNLLMKLIGASLASGLERMRVAALLAETEERNKLINLTANDGIWDFDGQTKKIALSRRWKEMLGYDQDREDVLPDWYRLVHPDDMARVQAKMREHLEGKTPFFESMHRMKHQSGEWRWMTSRAKALQDDKGRLVRLLGVEVDITERKLYEIGRAHV